MKHLIKFFIGFTLVFLSANATVAGMVEFEEGTEIKPSLYYLGKSLNGKIEVKVCDECETVKLTITPKTEAFEGKKQVSLASKVKTTKKPDLIFFEIKTKNVTRLIWL